jgi:hypothetical protein
MVDLQFNLFLLPFWLAFAAFNTTILLLLVLLTFRLLDDDDDEDDDVDTRPRSLLGVDVGFGSFDD